MAVDTAEVGSAARGFSVQLSDEQKMVRQTLRDYADAELIPTALERDKEKRFPHEQFDELAEMGFTGMSIPEEHGGNRLDSVSQAIAIEEISRGDAALGVAIAVQVGLVADPIIRWGTDRQKQTWLPKLASGELIGAYSLSEPDSGSDAASLSCRAERDGDEFVINGTKTWVTNGKVADVYIVFVRTDQDAPKHKGISALIVPDDTEGFRVGKVEDKMGMNASDTAELIFDDARVPAENLLGDEGIGFRIALQALDVSRIGIAAQALGIGQGAMDTAVQYMDEREQFGQKLREIQTLKNYVAEMETRLEAARLLTYQAAELKGQNADHTKESSMAKQYASETAMFVSDKAVQLLGGYGYTTDFPAERYLREAKLTEIYEGTTEIQQLVIARETFREHNVLD